MVLSQIIEYKKTLVRNIHIDENTISKSSKSLKEALSKKRTNFLCEVKIASPAKGPLRKTCDVVQIAKLYDKFASAISVLADERFFLGSLENVKKVSQEVSCPVLCKDIVVSPKQILQARSHGADAVLLMLSVLNDEEYLQCKKIAQSLNLDIVTEVHKEEEAQRALKLKADIVGINNRNLNTLQIDLDVTQKLASFFSKDTIIISASGYSSHQDIQRFASLVDGFLIGSSLMKASRVDLRLRELLFGRIKICGLTNLEDAKMAYEYGAYYGGLNFIESSKRYISEEKAQEIVSGGQNTLLFGGVFADHHLDYVIKVAKQLKLSFVQLHGSEEKSYIRELRRHLPYHCEIFKCLRVKDYIDWSKDYAADIILFDSYDSVSLGGTGKAFNWNLLKEAPRDFKFMLAGGISAENIMEASETGAFALDMASLVEEYPGKKSPQKIQEIFAILRGSGRIR